MSEEIHKEYLKLCTEVGNLVFEKADLEARLKQVVDALADASKKRLDLQKQLEATSVDVSNPAG